VNNLSPFTIYLFINTSIFSLPLQKRKSAGGRVFSASSDWLLKDKPYGTERYRRGGEMHTVLFPHHKTDNLLILGLNYGVMASLEHPETTPFHHKMPTYAPLSRDSDRDNNISGNIDENSDLQHKFSLLTDESAKDRVETVKRRMKVLTALAAIGGFLFGYDTGVISGAMPPLARAFNLSIGQQGFVVSSTVLSAFLASIVGGTVNDRYGRKKTIIIASSVFTVGGILMGVALNYSLLVIGRLTIGVGIGLSSLTSPMYIAEVAAPAMRGTLVTINLFMVCFGQFFAGMLDGIFDQIDPDNGWRLMLGLAAVPSLVMLIGFQYLPESPRWLAMNGRHDEARVVLRSVRDTDSEADEELNEIIYIVDIMNSLGRDDNEDGEEMNNLDSNDHGHIEQFTQNPSTGRVAYFKHLKEMLSHSPTRRALILGCGMMLLQQLSGINTVMYFAASIYEMSGFEGRIQSVLKSIV
jgi:MFS family permease